MIAADIILNLAIFLSTTLLLGGLRRRTVKDRPEQFRKALRFFTCQSNILCSLSALVTAFSGCRDLCLNGPGS